MLKKFIFAIAGTFIFVSSSFAVDDTTARKSLMKAVAAAAGVGVPILKGADMDSSSATLAAATMAAAGNAFPKLFGEDNSSDANTEAGAKIWTDSEGFQAIASVMAETGEAAMVAAKASDVDGFKASFGKVMSTCRECHTTYRVKK